MAGAGGHRFVDYTGSVQSIVTSGASNDSGLFETNLRDERFLPFEGAGAVSTWQLDLPKDYYIATGLLIGRLVGAILPEYLTFGGLRWPRKSMWCGCVLTNASS
jgi:hypothetical protein